MKHFGDSVKCRVQEFAHLVELAHSLQAPRNVPVDHQPVFMPEKISERGAESGRDKSVSRWESIVWRGPYFSGLGRPGKPPSGPAPTHANSPIFMATLICRIVAGGVRCAGCFVLS